jgi:hypothetical protein
MMQHSDREWERPCCDAMNRAYYSSAKEYYFSTEDLEPREILLPSREFSRNK